MKKILFAALLAGLLAFGCDDDDNGPTGSRGDDNPAGRLYVANQTDNTIYVYDTRTMTRIDSFSSVIETPHFVRISPDGSYLYAVGRETPGQFAKFSLADNNLVDSLTAGGDLYPTAIATSPDGSIGYVCDFTDPSKLGKLHQFNLNTMTFLDSQVTVGSASHDLQITSDGEIVVVGNFGTDNISLVYPTGDSAVNVDVRPGNPVPAGSPVCGPYGIAIDHSDSLAFIACRLSNEIRVLDLASRTIVDSIPIPVQGTGSLFGPTLMAVSPDNSKLYITTQLENTVAVLRLATRRVIAQIELGVIRPFGIDCSDDGSRYYVACVNNENPLLDQTGRVYVIDGATNVLIDSVDVGKNSYGLAFKAVN